MEDDLQLSSHWLCCFSIWAETLNKQDISWFPDRFVTNSLYIALFSRLLISTVFSFPNQFGPCQGLILLTVLVIHQCKLLTDNPENTISSRYYDTDKLENLKITNKSNSLSSFHINASSLSKHFDDLQHLLVAQIKTLTLLL